MSRRERKLTRRALLLRAGIAAAGPAIGACAWEVNRIVVTRHTVPLRGLPPGVQRVRVVQLSDLHRGWLVAEGMIERAAQIAAEQHPDLVALTGDFVSRNAENIVSCARALSELRARYGVWCVRGNHDYWTRDIDRVMGGLRDVGFQELVNEHVAVGVGRLRIVGLDDPTGGKSDPAQAFRGVDPGDPVIVLSHQPQAVAWVQRRPVVVLAGHTHGGQVYFPGREWTMPGGGYVAGWYRRGQARLYVNRGIGVVGLPIRVMAAPEVSVFDFVPEAAGSGQAAHAGRT